MPKQFTCLTCGVVSTPGSHSGRRERRYCSITCARARFSPSFEISDDGLFARMSLRRPDGSVREYALIDVADIEWVSQWHWYWNGLYVVCYSRGGSGVIWLHRALLGLGKRDGQEVDHINRDRLDNRRANLRIVTHAQNAQNVPARRNAKSSYRGVAWESATGKWRAGLQVNKRHIHLGRFDNELDAAKAAFEGRRRLLPYAVD